jgi:hypothetical protein
MIDSIVTTLDLARYLDTQEKESVRILFTPQDKPNLGVIVKFRGTIDDSGEDPIPQTEIEKIFVRANTPIRPDTPKEQIQVIVKANDLPADLMVLFIRIHDRFVSWQRGLSIFQTFQMEDVNYALLGED